MKKCPFCAESIQVEAIKCRFCGEFFDGSNRVVTAPVKKEGWKNKTSSIILGYLCIGPFILPLVWMNEKFSLIKKVVITIVIVIATWVIVKFMMGLLVSIKAAYEPMLEMMG